jgi:hypothetical protein
MRKIQARKDACRIAAILRAYGMSRSAAMREAWRIREAVGEHLARYRAWLAEQTEVARLVEVELPRAMRNSGPVNG